MKIQRNGTNQIHMETSLRISKRLDLDLELRKRTLGERGGKEEEESEEENPNVLHRHDWKLWTGW